MNMDLTNVFEEDTNAVNHSHGGDDFNELLWETITMDDFVFEEDSNNNSNNNNSNNSSNDVNDETSAANTKRHGLKQKSSMSAELIASKKSRQVADTLHKILEFPFQIQNFCNAGDIDGLYKLIDDVCAERCVFRWVGSDACLETRSAIKKMLRDCRESSPDTVMVMKDVRYNVKAGILSMKIVGTGTRQFAAGSFTKHSDDPEDKLVTQVCSACDPLNPASIATGIDTKVHEEAKFIHASGKLIQSKFSAKWTMVLNKEFTKILTLTASAKKMLVFEAPDQLLID